MMFFQEENRLLQLNRKWLCSLNCEGRKDLSLL